MPTVAIIDGVKIQLYPDEHPPPHFHAVFAEHVAQVEIQTAKVLRGSLPPAKLNGVLEWARSHRSDLLEAWAALEMGRKPGRIA